LISVDAPFFSEVAKGPSGGRAYWVNTEDDKKIRLGVWENGNKGTIVIFPGRAEYIEKYGIAAAGLAERGYSTVAVDWRGQGLTERLVQNKTVGHINDYSYYQNDVRALFNTINSLNLPKPLYLLAHSMGGCIGLRSLINELPVNAAVFTSPMWGLSLSPFAQLGSLILSPLVRSGWFSTKTAPRRQSKNYVINTPFEKNILTSCPDMYAVIRNQLSSYPELILGGPTIGWIYESVKECQKLLSSLSPTTPSLVLIGSNEHIIDLSIIRKRIQQWDQSELTIIAEARHELIMEVEKIRQKTLDLTADFFNRHSNNLSYKLKG